MVDKRNVLDEFKNRPHAEIISELNERGVSLEIAIENTLRDFNMGSIVRSANAFGVRTIHVIGRRQWNKRGAMMTDTYLRMEYYSSVEAFRDQMRASDRYIYALENNVRSTSLFQTNFKTSAVIVFGQEGPGISKDLLSIADETVSIDQLGSTRSLNVGVAAGIAMYEWSKQQL